MTNIYNARRILLALLVGVVVYLGLMALPSAQVPKTFTAQAASCKIMACYVPGLGQYLRAVNGAKLHYCDENVIVPRGSSGYEEYTTCLVRDEHMTHAGRDCLLAAGITAGGVAVGGWIGGATARVIAGGIVGGGGAACIAKIVG